MAGCFCYYNLERREIEMDNLGAEKQSRSSSGVGCSPSVGANDQPASPPLGGTLAGSRGGGLASDF